MKYLTLLVLFSQLLMAQDQYEEISFDYKSLQKRPYEFERKKLKLSGIVTDLKAQELKNNLKYLTFKLSKTSNVKQYLQVYYFTQFGDRSFPVATIKNNQILQLEGEFRQNYEISKSKLLGSLYINKNAFDKLRAFDVNKKRSESYIIPEKNNATLSTVYEMGLDYTGADTAPIVKVQGYITNIQYKEEKNGDAYWEIHIKDHMKKDSRSWADYTTIVRYYIFLRGNRYADINIDDFFTEDQRISFKGRYIYKEKAEVNPIVSTIEMNYLDQANQYQDHFVTTFIKAKRKAVAIISNANNDTDINQRLRNGEFIKKQNFIEDDI
jgi:hypothetical protein